MKIDFSRKPSKKEWGKYNQWVKYLSDSKLSKGEIASRAAAFVNQGQKVPKE